MGDARERAEAVQAAVERIARAVADAKDAGLGQSMGLCLVHSDTAAETDTVEALAELVGSSIGRQTTALYDGRVRIIITTRLVHAGVDVSVQASRPMTAADLPAAVTQ